MLSWMNNLDSLSLEYCLFKLKRCNHGWIIGLNDDSFWLNTIFIRYVIRNHFSNQIAQRLKIV